MTNWLICILHGIFSVLTILIKTSEVHFLQNQSTKQKGNFTFFCYLAGSTEKLRFMHFSNFPFLRSLNFENHLGGSCNRFQNDR